ncbi:FUSC family protein [Paenibacillus sp. EC2-1]|uniref:FUSC family protein n=1 Tax=Paenibacillus sp. EC2-1 TaxID=3388665 RepID=UPI003BEED3D9
MKQLIYAKTKIFIYILLFIFAFNSLFGKDNTLIGVTIVIATLMYLERDLTKNPWKNLLFLLTVNLLQGIFGYISAVHMWIGIPLNLISMFIVGYFFSFNLKKPLTIAFGLQYLFILTTPVTFEALPLRLMALALGAVIIMVAQFIFNHNKMEKIGHKLLITINEQLIQKLKAIQSEQDHHQFNPTIDNAIKEIRRIVYHQTIDGYYVSNESRIYLKTSACFEKLYLLLNDSHDVRHKDHFMEALIHELSRVNQFLRRQESMNESRLQGLRDFELEAMDDLYITEWMNTFELIYELIEELHTTNKKELRKVEKLENIPKYFKKTYNHTVNFNKNSVRFTYAVRVSLAVTIAAFISDYFALEQGKWMMFTIFSVTQPYSETAKFRFSERLKGTILGAALFFVLFSVFKSPTSHMLIVLLFGYLNSFAVAYRTIILTATVPALGTAALVSGMGAVTLERILYVVLGIGIGMLANRLILPYSIENGTAGLVRMYKDMSTYLIEELYDYFENPSKAHSIHHLFAISALIEDRILMNNETRELKDANRFLEELRRVNHAIYELFLRVQRKKLQPDVVKCILEEVNKMKDSSNGDVKSLEIKIKHTVQSHTHTVYETILIKDVLTIYRSFSTIMEYQPELV